MLSLRDLRKLIKVGLVGKGFASVGVPRGLAQWAITAFQLL